MTLCARIIIDYLDCYNSIGNFKLTTLITPNLARQIHDRVEYVMNISYIIHTQRGIHKKNLKCLILLLPRKKMVLKRQITCTPLL